MNTRTIFVVDQQGATFVFANQQDAEACLVEEAWNGAVHLTIQRCEAPAGLDGDALTEWAISNALDRSGCAL